MRVAILILLAVPAVADTPDVETFYRRLVKFDRRYQTMIHAACGWPERLEMLEPVCRPAEGRFDLKAFREAREAAKELFGLKD